METDNQEDLEEGDLSTHDMTKEICESEIETSFDIFQPTPEQKRKREVKRKSFSLLFGEESSDADYDKRQPSGTNNKQKQASLSPTKISFSSSDSDSMLLPSSHSSTSTSSIFSPLTRGATSPARKTVKITNLLLQTVLKNR